MKKSFVAALLVAGVVVCAESDVITKGNFKQLGADGLPEGWRTIAKAGAKVADDDEAGKVIEVVAGTKDTYGLISPMFPVTAGKSYLLTFKMRSRNFGEKGYDNISSSAIVRFKTADGLNMASPPNFPKIMKSGNPCQIGFPYTSVNSWTKRCINFIVPPGAGQAYFDLSLSNGKADTANPAVQICDFSVREMSSAVAADPLVKLTAAKMAKGEAADKSGDSDVTTKADKNGNIFYGPYAKMAPGIYEVTVKVKSDKVGSNEPLFAISIENTGTMSGIFALTGNDFKVANEYQEFKFRVLKPDGEFFNLPCYKAAGVGITVDTLTIAPVKQFAPNELEDFYTPADTEAKASTEVKAGTEAKADTAK